MFAQLRKTRTAQAIAITDMLNQAQARALSHRRIVCVIETVHNNLQRKLSPKELARVVNLSPSRLRNLFKEVTGLPLAQYIKLRRIEQAAYLMKTEFLSIKEALVRVGINDASHFVRDFKAVYGVTPAHYRGRYPQDWVELDDNQPGEVLITASFSPGRGRRTHSAQVAGIAWTGANAH